MRVNAMISKQDGTALIVGLVLLAILTVLGTSSLSTSLLGEKIAANIQNDTLSFHTADSAVNRTITLLRVDELTTGQARDADEQGNPPTQLNYSELSGTKSSTNNTTVEVMPRTHTFGSRANDRNGVIAHAFRITSEARIDNTHTRTTIQQTVDKGPYVRNPVKEF